MVDMKVSDLEVLYEDNHIIVVIKPINVLSQADNTNDPDMLSIVKKYLKEKYNKPGNVYLGLVHRLDRPVGGIMVFAKTSKAASRLSDTIRKGEFHKKYYAVVRGALKNKHDKLINYIKKEDNKSVITDEKDGKYSELSYNVIEEINDLSLVDIDLKTGRHHQIRVQFQHINHPLYGDQRYGIEDKKQIGLYAYHLEFIHPVKKELMIFDSKPKYGIFLKFKSIK